MLTYELAKQLKDAGFPQSGCDCNWIFDNPGGEDGETYAPTLSELIEACGTGEFFLSRNNDTWEAMYDDTEDCVMDCCGSTGQGNAPEEAVASLWLNINKDSNKAQ